MLRQKSNNPNLKGGEQGKERREDHELPGERLPDCFSIRNTNEKRGGRPGAPGRDLLIALNKKQYG